MSIAPDKLIGSRVVGDQDAHIGKITHVYNDPTTNLPKWASVKTGMFGGSSSVVPLDQARLLGNGDVSVPYSKALVQDAPWHEPGAKFNPKHDAAFSRHYKLSNVPPATTPPTRPEPVPHAAPVPPVGSVPPADVPPPFVDPNEVIRSEEEVEVGVDTVRTGKVRLKKDVVVEPREITVPVSHEEAVIEREPLGDIPVDPGTELVPEEHEVTLHKEVPVVKKHTVAKERVKLRKDVVTDAETIATDVKKEQVHVEEVVENQDRPLP